MGPEETCVAGGDAPAPHYEAAPVEPDTSVTAAMQPELKRVARWREAPLGIVLETPLARNPNGLESPLGNLFADAILAAVPGADVAIGLGARRGGLRADLPAGVLTRGPLYDVFPFDNHVVSLSLTGAQLRQVLTDQVARRRRGLPSVSGFRVRVTCEEDRPDLEIVRSSGVKIDPTETLIVSTTDFFARRARFSSHPIPPETPLTSATLVRNAAAAWLTARGGQLRGTSLIDPPRWEPLDSGACLVADRSDR